MRTVVVGAGISGLAAAWTLRDRPATVLEAGDQAGGRMRSRQVDGSTLELGAQFLSSHYSVLPELAREMGLALTPVAPGTAVVRGGHLRRFRSDRPLTQFTGGLLPWRAAPRAAPGLARVASLAAGRDLHDLTAWTALDSEPGHEWARRTLGRHVTESLLRPTIHAFYFQSLSESSAALAAAVSAFGTKPGTTLTIDGGLGRLTQALAARLDVRLGCAVRSVRRVGPGAVVTTDSGEIHADHVIVAVPGPAALGMLRDPSDAERDVMTTPYSAGLLVGIPLSRPLGPDHLGGAYGALVHPDETTPIAAVAVASRAHPRDAGDLITVLLSHQSATAFGSADDPHVAATALEALAQLDAPLRSVLPARSAGACVTRHEHAMPTCPPGHGAAVAAYRSLRQGAQRDDPVTLAGDYLGFPWTDSAAATGVWAARMAIARDRARGR
jgi:oxygen-dependent protoporphyrinogen oxidase